MVQTNYIFDFDLTTPTISTFPAVNFDPITTNDPAWFISSVGGNTIYYNNLMWITGPTNRPVWETTNSWPAVSLTNIASFAEASGIEAPQLGSTRKIRPASASAIMMAVTRKLDGVQYLWTSRQIGVNYLGNNDSPNSADRLGIEWFKIQVTSSISNTASGRIHDAATTNANFYYTPSLVVNTKGDMLLGFSGSSMTNYVGTYYWGRLNGGASPATPIRYFAGKDWCDAQGANTVRLGDYSHTSLDPDGLTFWTIQEYAETRYLSSGADNAWGTRIVRIAPY